jgi:phosphatidylinositol glycan class B
VPRRPALWVLAASIALGTAYRLWVAFTDDGIFWPDEIFQSLEPAHRLVFGYGLVPWEFIDGARNWALPGFVAALIKLGGDDPRAYLGVVRVAFVAIAAGTSYGVFRLARAYGADELPAAIGAACFSLGALPIYFGHRAMSETASALPVVLGLWLTIEKNSLSPEGAEGRGEGPWWRKPTIRILIGGSLLGVAVLFRLQCGIFAAGAVITLLARKKWQPALELFGVLLAWALIFGALDKLTWGDWFHSAVKYLQFNLIENRAANWGSHPWHHLVVHLFTSMSGLTVVFAISLVAAFRKAPALAAIALTFLVLHSSTAHKEIRFILPVLPLFCACVGIALDQVKTNRAPAAIVLVLALASLIRAHALTFGDLGAYPERSEVSAWDDYGPVNRLLLAAHQRENLCGIRIDVAHLAWTGGSTYLHRNAPLYHLGQPSPQTRLFNYVITQKGSGAEVVASEGSLELVHLPVEPCASDPGYSWRLP